MKTVNLNGAGKFDIFDIFLNREVFVNWILIANKPHDNITTSNLLVGFDSAG